MAFNYGAIRDGVVIPQIASFGKPATLEQPGATTGPGYDPTPGTPITYAVTALEVNFTAEDKSGGLVREDDIKFMLSTDNDPLPDLKGTLSVNGLVYQIVSLAPKRPGDTTLFWNLHCRK